MHFRSPHPREVAHGQMSAHVQINPLNRVHDGAGLCGRVNARRRAAFAGGQFHGGGEIVPHQAALDGEVEKCPHVGEIAALSANRPIIFHHPFFNLLNGDAGQR